jgi:16S rRNA (uracil1498-N3)-methyltransferase
MPRFLIQPENISEGRITIQGADARHIKNVLRYKMGESISLTDGQGLIYDGVIEDLKSTIKIKINHKRALTSSTVELCCAQAIIKNDKMDWAIQKATELGVSRIIPFTTERTVLRGNPPVRQKRWEKIMLEAMKQSGQPFQIKLEPIQSFESVLKISQDYDLKILGWEKETSHTLKKVLRHPDRDLTTMKSVFYCIGPEGGFTETEVEAARHHNFIPISLGDNILRAETAGMSLASILQYEIGKTNSHYCSPGPARRIP